MCDGNTYKVPRVRKELSHIPKWVSVTPLIPGALGTTYPQNFSPLVQAEIRRKGEVLKEVLHVGY
jgi:hypothetical protein